MLLVDRLAELAAKDGKEDHYHCQASLAEKLDKQFPLLSVSAYVNRNGVIVYTSVRRDDRGREPLGSKDICDPELRKWLAWYAGQAELALQDNWFFCCGHNRAEPQGPGEYFWFAGRYCKEYGQENPDHLKKAKAETYN